MQKNKIFSSDKMKKILAILFFYIGSSFLFLIVSQDNGTIPVWIFQAVIGPLWHLAAFFGIARRPFGYVDGVVRVTNETILMASLSLVIWIISGILIVLFFGVENKNIKRILLILVVVIWLLVGYLNIFLYGLFTV